jgi:hypothetical protein
LRFRYQVFTGCTNTRNNSCVRIETKLSERYILDAILLVPSIEKIRYTANAV